MNRSPLQAGLYPVCFFIALLLPLGMDAQCPFAGTFTSDHQIRIPNTGTGYRIRITARGADGGNYGPTTGRGGSGATIVAEFTVYANDVLDIYVGEAGRTQVAPPPPLRAGGGGGGSAVVINNNIVLIAAAGGGGPGGNASSPHHGRGGGANISSVPTGGTSLSGHGAGGGGFGIQNEGDSGFVGVAGGGGAATLNFAGYGGSGAGGNGVPAADGGYGFGGGGGGGNQSGGGGGGFRGGDGGVVSATGSDYAGGDGGDSFVTGAHLSDVISAIAGVDGAGLLQDGEIIIECITALPVAFIAFSGRAADQHVELTWITAEEVDNRGFEVQHSKEGIHWQKIGFVAAQDKLNETSTYHYLHEQPAAGLNYYRLRQIDIDGDFDYSEIITVILNSLQTITLFPNPTSGRIFLSGAEIDNAQVDISDIRGKLVKQLRLSGRHLNISDLPAGIYLLTLKTPNQTFTKQVIKE